MDQPLFRRNACAADGATHWRSDGQWSPQRPAEIKAPSWWAPATFYGILRVMARQDSNGPFRELQHGRTRHGFQYLQDPRRDWPTSYYGPHSGIAIGLKALGAAPNRKIAVVGLGTGTLAAWGRPGDSFRFYEINPDVEQIARTWFSFLSDSKAQTEVVLGDARVALEAANWRCWDKVREILT